MQPTLHFLDRYKAGGVCTSRLTLLILSIILFGFDQTVHAEIRVYDANNQFLGIAIGSMGTMGTGQDSFAIYIPAVSMAMDLQTSMVEYTAYVPQSKGGVRFLDDKCKGTAYHLNCNPRNISHLSRMVNGKLVVADQSACFELSGYYELGSDGVCYHRPPDWKVPPAGEMIDFDESTLPFTLPVALPLRYEYINCCEKRSRVVVIPLP